MLNKIKSSLELAIIGTLVGTASISFAAPAPTTVGNIDNVQGQIILLQAKSKLAEAQATLSSQYAKSQEEAAKAKASEKTNASVQEELPFVTGVYGDGAHQMTAKLAYTSGASVDARTGMVLPGGEKILTIKGERVTVLKNGQEKVLPIAAY